MAEKRFVRKNFIRSALEMLAKPWGLPKALKRRPILLVGTSRDRTITLQAPAVFPFLMVAKEARGKGLALRLKEELERVLKEEGIDHCQMVVNRNNAPL